MFLYIPIVPKISFKDSIFFDIALKEFVESFLHFSNFYLLINFWTSSFNSIFCCSKDYIFFIHISLHWSFTIFLMIFFNFWSFLLFCVFFICQILRWWLFSVWSDTWVFVHFYIWVTHFGFCYMCRLLCSFAIHNLVVVFISFYGPFMLFFLRRAVLHFSYHLLSFWSDLMICCIVYTWLGSTFQSVVFWLLFRICFGVSCSIFWLKIIMVTKLFVFFYGSHIGSSFGLFIVIHYYLYMLYQLT